MNADYILYLHGLATGIIEGKKSGTTLTGVEVRSAKYSQGLADIFPAWHRPLPFVINTTDNETRFTNCLEPDARSRQVFAFHISGV